MQTTVVPGVLQARGVAAGREAEAPGQHVLGGTGEQGGASTPGRGAGISALDPIWSILSGTSPPEGRRTDVLSGCPGPTVLRPMRPDAAHTEAGT